MTSAKLKPKFNRSIIAASVLLALSIPASSADHLANQQYALEIINKARLDPDTYAASLGITLNEGLAAGTITNTPKQPLAGNTLLQNAAKAHNDWLFSSNQFSHTGSGGSTPGTRATAAGYTWSTVGENLQAAYNTSLNLNTHSKNAISQLFIDAGVVGRGHRVNLMKNDFREIGIGDGLGAWSGFGSLRDPTYLHTELFGTAQGSQPFITGVVYADTNSNGTYDPGEGIANEGVNIGTGPVTSTTAAGGYKVTASAGTNTLNFNGGATVNVVVSTNNVKVDRVGSTIYSSGDTTLVLGATTLELLGVGALNGTGSASDETLLGNRSANTLIGNGGDDLLKGLAGIDTYLYPTNNFGNDTIEDGTNDIIKFSALQCNGLTYARSNDNLVITASSGNTINVKDYYVASKTYVIKDSSNTTCSPSTSNNQSPIAGNDSATTTPGTAVTVTNVLSNDSDPDGHTLTITGNTNPTKGTVTRSGSNFTYTPNTGISNTTDSFTYTISDGNGGTATATVTITIGASVTGPKAVEDVATTNFGEAVTVNLLENDTPKTGVTVNVVTQPKKGRVTIHRTTGVTKYTPNKGQEGTDTFSYSITNAARQSSTALVTIVIKPLVKPVAQNDTASTKFNTPVTIKVLENDTGTGLALVSATKPTKGKVTLNTKTGQATYTPNKGTSGNDTFAYTVKNTVGGTATANVSVTVATNTPPVVTNWFYSVSIGKPREINFMHLHSSDINGDQILANQVMSKPTKGTVSIKNGRFIYMPKKGAVGSDSFTYTVKDQHGAVSNTATINLNISNVPSS